MLSLKEFREKTENQISSVDIGKFIEGYDTMHTTTKDQNPYDQNHCDRTWFDYSYDGKEYKGEDYRAGNDTLDC